VVRASRNRTPTGRRALQRRGHRAAPSDPRRSVHHNDPGPFE
jgi:hypothetical protein